MDRYAVLDKACGEITREKSRFIALIQEIHSEEEALDIIEHIRKEYWNARHNCFAYVLGPNNECARFSDDKEPSGTAGKPILDVLLGSGARNAVIVVTRYFGGVLLGTGGLVRAYTDSSLAALDNLKNEGKFLRITDGVKIRFFVDYKDIGSFDSLSARFHMCTVSKEYLENAVYTMIIENGFLDAFIKEAMNITRGSFSLESKENITYCPNGSEAVIYDL